MNEGYVSTAAFDEAVGELRAQIAAKDVEIEGLRTALRVKDLLIEDGEKLLEAEQLASAKFKSAVEVAANLSEHRGYGWAFIDDWKAGVSDAIKLVDAHHAAKTERLADEIKRRQEAALDELARLGQEGEGL